MTLREKQSEFFVWIGRLTTYANDILIHRICPLEWKRSAEQQAINVIRGASQVKYSMHQDGLALDFCFIEDLLDDGKINWNVAKYKQLGEYWEKLGGRWGGRFGQTNGQGNGWDAGHFEWKAKEVK